MVSFSPGLKICSSQLLGAEKQLGPKGLVESWERRRYPLDLPDPVEAIKYHMEQSGLQLRDLIPFIGSRNRVHEMLNRKRELTLNMSRQLHEGLGIPAESLIKVGPHKAA